MMSRSLSAPKSMRRVGYAMFMTNSFNEPGSMPGTFGCCSSDGLTAFSCR